MSVTWGGNVEANEQLQVLMSAVNPEHPDPRAPRAPGETLVDWVCRFTDVRLDAARMVELAHRHLGVTA
jgi:hypothetical protein